MSKDIRIATDFFDHWKTLSLQSELGDEAVLSLMRLWMFAAKNKPSGILDGMNEKAIALASKFSGDEQKFIEVLLALKFIEKSKNGTCCLHDWSMHNSFVYHADGRKQQARVAAKARWESKRGVKKTKEKQEVNADRITDSNADLEKSNAECNAPYPYPTPYPYPYPKEHSTKLGIVKTTKQNFPSEPNSALSHERNAKNPKNENSTQQTPAEFDEDAFRCQAKLKRCSESAIGYAIEEMRKAKGLTNPHGYALKIARDKTQRENAEKSEKESKQHKQDLGQIHSNLSRLSMQIGKAF